MSIYHNSDYYEAPLALCLGRKGGLNDYYLMCSTLVIED